ncbi:SIS domain-containing protein [Paenibacillus thermotolerans]|uniref:SIS domain-containing protein n=1 Tax=Paenibacillus thermotolerans TaxID=3027807 RepID=UPI002368C767|nr:MULTISPECIES: SIS domain-containing protein [unclassified Paenibacillus]
MIERYFSVIRSALDDVLAAQTDEMRRVADLFKQTIMDGGTVYITGCSHSSIFAQEVFYRAGGLMLINPIFAPGMTLESAPVTRTSKYERISGIAAAVLSESAVRPGDVLVIASISGRNDVPIEMALWARERRITVVALTSTLYSASVASRHSSGKRLFELADYVLDVRSPVGDAVLDIEGLPVKTAPSSTVIGVTMLHAVISETIAQLLKAGVEPPVLLSANIDGADERNRKMLEDYKDRITYM